MNKVEIHKNFAKVGCNTISDVNLVAMAEDVGGHFGVPEAGLMAEVDTGFQHFAHGDGHGFP